MLSDANSNAHDRFGPGNVAIADDGVEHQPVAEDGAPCIRLAASGAPLRCSSR